MNWKQREKKSSRTNFRYYNGMYLEGLRETAKNLFQDIRSAGRDLNPGPPEYEAGVLTTRPRHSLRTFIAMNNFSSLQVSKSPLSTRVSNKTRTFSPLFSPFCCVRNKPQFSSIRNFMRSSVTSLSLILIYVLCTLFPTQ
jgi:hypothetical protein